MTTIAIGAGGWRSVRRERIRRRGRRGGIRYRRCRKYRGRSCKPPGDPASFAEAFVRRLVFDVAEAHKGETGSPFKTGVEILRVLRHVVRAGVEHGRLSPASRALIDATGQSVPTVQAFGIPTEGATYFNHYLPSPRSRAGAFERLAAAIEGALCTTVGQRTAQAARG